MIRIKTKTNNLEVYTLYLPQTREWITIRKVNVGEKITINSTEASNLYDASLNHLKACKN